MVEDAETWVGQAKLSEPAARSLDKLTKIEGCSLFETYVAITSTLVGRLAGREEVAIVVPCGGTVQKRDALGKSRAHRVVTIPVSGRPEYRVLLRRVRSQWREAIACEAGAGEDALWPADTWSLDTSHVLFAIVDCKTLDWIVDAPGQGVRLFCGSGVIPLMSLFVEDANRPRVICASASAAFGPDRVVEVARQFAHLAAQVAADPATEIDRYSLVTASAAAVLPDPTAPLDASWLGSVHERFCDHARRAPERLAVVDAIGAVTYGELDDHTSAVAISLLGNGVGAGDVVAVYGYRDAGLVSAVLGILKAGAGFLILDPQYPVDRLAAYVAIAQPKAWIHLAAAGSPGDAFVQAIQSIPCHTIARSDVSARRVTHGRPHRSNIAVHADTTACISFTSGSTGTPKAVVGRHGSLTHFIPWQQQRFELRESDRFGMLSGLAHDPLQRDMFTPLQLGATICIPSAKEYSEPGSLVEWIRQSQVTVLHMTPGMARIVAGQSSTRLPSLRLAFIVGDVLSRADVKRLRRVAPHIVCVNFYGTTETQRAVAHFVVPPEDVDSQDDCAGQLAALPLGAGIPDVQLLVLMPRAGLAGIGEVGEIVFRSPHLAKGYLADEKLTQERFVANPITKDRADRVYRTGDLGRYRADGLVEFVGRADAQVKIRGYRVELGEIEAALRNHDAVTDAVVVADVDPATGVRELAGYVASTGRRATSTELRLFLAARLPDYMVPASIAVIERFPMTPNGKVDRQALRAGSAPREVVSHTPRNATEEMLAAIWQDVLGTAGFGIHDNLFVLGGHSLSAIQIIARVRARMGVELTVVDVFVAPTVAALAEIVGADVATRSEP
jgi:amino acid adenylation domain-containing protein